MSESPGAQPAAKPTAMRRKWFPLLWIGVPLAIALALHELDFDPGVVNSILHGTVVAGTVGLTVWLVVNSGWTSGGKWLVAVVPSLLVIAQYLQLTPVEMILDGDVGLVGFRWRGTEPDKLLAMPTSKAESSLAWQVTDNDYPRFLGTGYWAEVPNVELETDWDKNPPRELWRKKIGAGWSAFAVVGDYAITQEQRDQNELVTCYDVQTGEIAWTHADPVRWDPGGTGALGYAGPRATPTIHGGKVFSHGATGILNCLDAPTGKLLWSHDTLAENGAENVNWGKAGSPLVVDQMVVVSVGGTENRSLVAYDIDTGEVVWAAGDYQSSYASPIVAEFAGMRQIVSVDENYITARRADNGDFLWEYEWPSNSGGSACSSQPVPLPEDQIFFSKGYGHGSALVKITHDEESGWQTIPLWEGARRYGEKPVMKTKMGNVLIREDYVYGIDDIYLQCIELNTGKKRWKKRRSPKIGHGQVMLVGGTILVLSEGGELILVEASPKKYNELASLRVFDDRQITWNNPAFAPPYLLVRNSYEAACYEMPIRRSPESNKQELALGKPRD